MSIKLTDTQLVMLSAAARREDRCLVAPPTLKGGAAQKVANKLISAGLVKEIKAKTGNPVWRHDEATRQAYALKLTADGAKAIAVDASPEPEPDCDEDGSFERLDQKSALAEAVILEKPPTEAIEPACAGPSAPRGGSKLMHVVELLERDCGSTIEELIAATGWLAHTTRAALTGLRKRGYKVAIDRSDDKRGSFYRIEADKTLDDNAVFAHPGEGQANSATALKKARRRARPPARRAA